MAKKKNKYSFAKKRHSRQGIASTVFVGISLGIFCVAALCSLGSHGKGGMNIWGLWDLLPLVFPFMDLLLD